MRTALDVYGRALEGGGRLALRERSGQPVPLPVGRWTSVSAAGDAGLLLRCRGPVLDVGCGPGRLAAALSARRVPALGVDIAPPAVALAVSRGATVLRRSVFDRLPGERRWTTVLLADGNIGIGGDPARLLQRVRGLLRPGGVVLVELGAPGSGSRAAHVRLQDEDGSSDEFPWAWLAVDDVDAVAAGAGLATAEHWTEAGRWFAALVRP